MREKARQVVLDNIFKITENGIFGEEIRKIRQTFKEEQNAW